MIRVKEEADNDIEEHNRRQHEAQQFHDLNEDRHRIQPLSLTGSGSLEDAASSVGRTPSIGRSPKIARPRRTIVAPSWIAASKSSLIPIDSSDQLPGSRSSSASRSSRNLRNTQRMLSGSDVHG